jgi:DNA-binding response OmpR family regulator
VHPQAGSLRRQTTVHCELLEGALGVCYFALGRPVPQQGARTQATAPGRLGFRFSATVATEETVAEIEIMTERAEDLGGLVSALEGAGHRVAVAPISTSLGEGPDPDVVLVDAAKDFGRGRDATRGIRAHSPRVRLIVIMAPETIDAVGPDWGVDSFCVDGAAPEEYIARVRLAIDPDTYQVRLKARPLDLTYKEFQLLLYLAERPGRVFSRSRLLQEVWGYDFFGGTRTVDVHVRRLRAKLGAEYEAMIATVRNVGYKLEIPARPR